MQFSGTEVHNHLKIVPVTLKNHILIACVCMESNSPECEGLKKGNKSGIQYNLCKTATLERPKNGIQDRLSLNASQKYCIMLTGSILQYFRPSLSYQLSLRPLFLSILVAVFTGFTVSCKIK